MSWLAIPASDSELNLDDSHGVVATVFNNVTNLGHFPLSLVPQLGVDVDHNPTRKQGILPGYHPSLTLRVGNSAVHESRLSPSCGTSASQYGDFAVYQKGGD
jgi:hypothetical protein